MSKQLKAGHWRPSIRTYFIVMNMVVLCLLFPVAISVSLREETTFRDAQLAQTINLMKEGLKSRGASLAHSMALSAEQALAGYDFSFLSIMATRVVTSNPDIHYCLIMDNNRRAVIHSRPELAGTELDTPMDLKAAQILTSEFSPAVAEPGQQNPVLVNEGLTGEDAQPVLEFITPLYLGNQLWGVLRLGYSLTEHRAQILRTETDWAERIRLFKFYFLTLTALFFTVGMLVAAFFTHFFLKSVKTLHDGVKRVGQGELDHAIVQKGLICEEIRELTDTFNVMTERLRLSYGQLDEHNKMLEQKVAERTSELKETQAILLQQAHEAGMAEMAVGMLHNIGNAITPAKVSSSLILKRLEESLLRRHAEEAARQIGEALSAGTAAPEEQERLLAILRLLPVEIDDEYVRLAEEVRSIRDKHRHIEGIIKLQMRYARLLGTSVDVDVNRVTEDALRLLEQSLRQDAVRVETVFQAVPPVRIEESKLLQVIVNLIKNGCQAMEGMDADRSLTISTSFSPGQPGEPGRITLVIRDTGEGFSAAEEKQLFKFGYTTKSRGSGLGLHSCANYIIANGGTIEARSPGKGLGAEFRVHLPATGKTAAGDSGRNGLSAGIRETEEKEYNP